MGVRDLFAVLGGVAGASRDLRRVAEALERIAATLEVLTGGTRNSFRTLYTDGKGDQSGVFYVDDPAEAALEERQVAYMLRTGVVLRPGEEPPSHGVEPPLEPS